MILTPAVLAEDQPLTKKLPTPENLTLVGGWIVPHAAIEGQTTSFAAPTFSTYVLGGKRYFWHGLHGSTGLIMRFQAPAMGTGTAESWPELEESRITCRPYGEVTAQVAYCGLSGFYFDPEKDRLWVSGRSSYSTISYQGPWLVTVDKAASLQPIVNKAVRPTHATIQGNGGGFVRIPKGFADQYLGGRELGLARGGYESGQESLAGPSLTAISLSGSKFNGVIGIRYGDFAGPKSQRERRPGDYNLRPRDATPRDTPGIDWAFEPEGDSSVWFAEGVKGNPAWISNASIEGLCFLVYRGVGDIYYKKFDMLQPEGFSYTGKTSLYTYSPKDIAKVASGQMRPHEIHGHFVDWESGTVPGIPRSMQYDPQTNHLFVEYQWALDEIEKRHVIACYLVTD